MKITYDAIAKALCIRLAPLGSEILRTVPLSKGVMIDYTKDGEVFGVEILNVDDLKSWELSG